MNPYLSWAIVLVVAGGLALYYKDDHNPRARPAPSKTIPEKSDNNNAIASKKPKRKQKKSPEASSGSGTPTPVLKIDTQASGQAASAEVAAQDEVDNKEFAKQFAKVKGGTPLSATGKNSKKEQALAKKAPSSSGSEVPGSHVSARASSTDGADADDDLSPVESPIEPSARASGDVSDMLEAPAPGASVLRLTGNLQNEQAKKKKQESFKPVETKKQRQQRLKNESKRAMVEEAEKQRRALLEKQLHSARESERREAARSKATPPKNAWAAGNGNAARATNGVSKTPATPSSSNGGLLDTFDSTPKPAAKQPVKSENIKPTNHTQQEGSWAKDLPSEEEQMRLLNDLNSENEWMTVSSKKKEKRKQHRADGSVSETSSSDLQAAKEPVVVAPPPVVAPAPVTVQEGSSINGKGGHPLDSDWTA